MMGYGMTMVTAYRMIFGVHAIIGAIELILTLRLSSACEVQKSTDKNDNETAPLLANGSTNGNAHHDNHEKRSPFASLPHLTTTSKLIIIQLCILFSFDSFASGLAPMYVPNAI
jgi:hypothetical protein